jgi:hypothetical protein
MIIDIMKTITSQGYFCKSVMYRTTTSGYRLDTGVLSVSHNSEEIQVSTPVTSKTKSNKAGKE